jgi:hypothetical protein
VISSSEGSKGTVYVKEIRSLEEEEWYIIWETSSVYGRRCEDMDPSVGFVVATELIT